MRATGRSQEGDVKLSKTRKILLSVGAVGAAASIAGLGTFATFTSSDAATHTISTGTVTIALGASGVDNRLNVGATGMVPGDSLQRRVKITNTGSESLASVTLSTTATTSSILDTDTTDGLKMKIERCSTTWLESVSTPYTYTCPLGTTSTVLARQAVIGSGLALSSMASLAAAGVDDLVVTVDLPSTAGNTFQTKTSIIQYTFTGTQRAGGAK
jgi:predicted ribosomally synthesized peptide with SipW-like signal peptide